MITMNKSALQTEPQKVPDGWQQVHVSELCEQINYGYTASADFNVDAPRFLRITDIQDGKVEWTKVPGCQISSDAEASYRLADGDIVFARTGGTTGKSFLIAEPPRAVFASYLIRLKPSKGIVVPEFMYYFFQSDKYWQQVQSSMRGGAQPNVNATLLGAITLPLPSFTEQQRIVSVLNEQTAAVERMREAVEIQIKLTTSLIDSYLRESLSDSNARSLLLNDCLTEIARGVGESWENYHVIGATRSGLAPAKAPVGKSPERYKLVDKGTIFYNPMRILIGSIGMVDEDDEPGITSPDYVVFKSQSSIVHPRWLYHWLRSSFGAAFIKTLARGAVRERLLFQRLAKAEILLPSWDTQVKVAEKLSAIAQLRQSLEEQLAAAIDLPEKLLHRAFNGEV